jgi:hypothetical protein
VQRRLRVGLETQPAAQPEGDTPHGTRVQNLGPCRTRETVARFQEDEASLDGPMRGPMRAQRPS